MERQFVPRLALLLCAVLMTLTTGALPRSAQTQRAEFVIVNNSDWDIHQLFLSPARKETWSADQLGDSIIKRGGGSFTLRNIPCGHYDLKVVGEDGDTCIIEDVVMCKDQMRRELSNKELAQCAG